MPADDPRWVLGLNTAGDTLGVALAEGGALRVDLMLLPAPGARLRHAERLMGAIQSACRLCDLTPTDLAALAVASGPGGFTGLRTAMAAAKAIAHALAKPLVSVPTLEALALQAPVSGLVSPLLDARGADLFAALYHKEGDDLVELEPTRLVGVEAWFARLAGEPVVFLGDGAVKHADKVAGRWPGEFDAAMHRLGAAAIARLADRHAGQDPRRVLPDYARGASAVARYGGSV
jgi:tRNA threonylcarbamoyladenosine biosynthesis protein TsaB